VQPSRLAKDLAQIQDPKVPGTPVRMVGLHATEAAEATLLPFFARAAGVSPPWFRFALATVIVFCGVITFRTAHSFHAPQLHSLCVSAPRLAYASRSWCTTFVRCKKRHLRCTNAHSQERRASARRGSVNRTSCRENRTLSGGWRMHKPGAAGVSPPWFRFALATVIVFCGVSITFRTAHSLPAPRLAYASRS
jgi:hypothetical protein